MVNRDRCVMAALLVLAACGWNLPGAAAADEEGDYGTPTMPRGEFIDFTLDSGEVGNPAAEEAVIYSQPVRVPGAAWMRLHFSVAALSPGSRVRMTALRDGEIQELDSEGLSMWGNASAFFNGDTVRVELIAAPGAKGCRLAMRQIMMELSGAMPEGASGQCGVCNTDDRVASNEDWACRIVPPGCSGTVYSRCSCVISAGHCVTTNMVLQFRVPNSLSNCDLVNPPVADQFPVLATQSNNGGVGADWSVMTSGTNNQGQKPMQRYGKRRRVSVATPSTGALSINGYGMDLTCTVNQTQRLSVGNVSSVSSTALNHGADIRGGNSGSGALRDNVVIGVATHCSPSNPCTGNVCQRVGVSAFVNARNSLCPCNECPGDIDPPGGNGTVNIADLLLVVSSWGASGINEADIGLNNVVNIEDLLAVIGGWGACP